MIKNNTIKLILSILICQLAGIIGSIFTVSSVGTWYLTLNKPGIAPPNYIFGPVWVFLYTLMGISLYLIIKKGFNNKKNKQAISLFGIHLVLNALWSIIFFGFHSPFYAFLEIIVLWIFIVIVIIKFWKINQLASILLVPYFLWVSFASFLNYKIWLLN